jgi:hypothetical protein
MRVVYPGGPRKRSRANETNHPKDTTRLPSKEEPFATPRNRALQKKNLMRGFFVTPKYNINFSRSSSRAAIHQSGFSTTIPCSIIPQ